MQIQHGNVCRPSEKRQPDRDFENEVRGSGVGAGYIVEEAMAKTQYDKDVTALLVIDPYNDFISEGGKIWPRIKAVAEANSCAPHMHEVLNAARKMKRRVFYAMHHRYRPGDYETWKYIAPIQKSAWQRKAF